MYLRQEVVQLGIDQTAVMLFGWDDNGSLQSSAWLPTPA